MPVMTLKQKEKSPRFRYYLRVRYGECDAQRVVFNVHYGTYVDLAVTEFVRSLGQEHQLIHGPFDYQLVKQTLEWKGSARFDQVLEISIEPSRLGNTSFTLAAEFRIAGQESVIATAETVYVVVDSKTLAKTPIPADFRAALERQGEELCVDHGDSTPKQTILRSETA